jgi:site-specific DNA-methyltransferase (adenine-specific)
MKPYYDEDGITIYHGDCREIAPSLEYDVVVADPPYGISHDCNYSGRGNLAVGKVWPDVYDDDKPFDPSPWITGPAILWGGNHFASRLPDSGGWLVWDKLRPDDLYQSTCELAWSNVIRGVRRFTYRWHGMLRDGDEVLMHPTQKPVALMDWVLSLKWMRDFSTVLDPYMGCGPVLVAAKNAGMKATGIEIEERYCETAANRLRQGVLFGAET